MYDLQQGSLIVTRCFLFGSQLAIEGNQALHSPYISMYTDQWTTLISVVHGFLSVISQLPKRKQLILDRSSWKFWGQYDLFWRFFEEFEGFWRNWLVVRRSLRTSIILRPTKKMRFWGQYGLQTALEVKSKIRFGIYGPNYLYHHVYFGCFDLLLESDRRKKEERKTTRPY